MKMPKSKLLNLPIIKPLVKYYVNYRVNKESIVIAEHFDQFLNSILVTDQELRNAVHHIRYDVYCEELKFEPENEQKMEVDEFDAFSEFCMVQHRTTENFAGCVRIVCPKDSEQLLPLEKYCEDSITDEVLTPKNYSRESICEVSRLAVPKQFRRRNSDKFEGAATGAFNEELYSESEMRCFPFIAVGLYICACHTVKRMGIEHAFVMMEPRLARSLKMLGINFTRIGPVVDYHGKRAPYHLSPEEFLEGLSPGFKRLSDNISRSLAIQAEKNKQ
ncbi:PEP-CTERM/exosortase system-associated acyltransferase [Psychrobium sp. 1_MG-2023]|uniref:PEP-CTERM/exosortase system-associated acyltransferase n=1 Tax=Psychrobium sp. 1_MG-2023 TaxID=3062624 RepID=UPI000C346A07|nr:PEP-CTERM/exosortase system-associated acyltransferase [Psychrobium sp. 1_MG-2023]MDP2561301.1 PEP-CTERM/exosortase system-associated acyltransferase [Psychrobium sp. 1_MG-2023]PKF54117.1 PEP-CTERM/exosortase system-associated acyltransferase [Alteromonadales bacterium alter-6D02]